MKRTERAVVGRAFVSMATSLILASCHHGDSAGASYALSGLPLSRYFPSNTNILTAADTYARRYDTDAGPRTDVWISGVALNEQQSALFNSKTLDDAEVGSLHTPGVLLRIKDDGLRSEDALVVCATTSGKGIECARGESGTIVVSQFGADRVKGALFTDSGDHDRRYALPIDAPLINTSIHVLTTANAWRDDAGRVSGLFSEMMKAAAVKDVETLRRLSIPEREHDWDHFGIISSIQRTAREAPQVIAVYNNGSIAHVWAITTAPEGSGRLPFRVELQNDGALWRVSSLIF